MIYVDGCSHTAGTAASINYETEKTYPQLLADFYEDSLVDNSHPNKSNDAIHRQLYEYLLGVNEIPSKVVIQWTMCTRSEVLLESGEYQSLNWGNDSSNREKKYTDTKLTHKLLTYIHSASLLLDHMGIDDYFFMTWTPLDTNHPIYKQLDKSKLLVNLGSLIEKEGFKRSTAIGRNGYPDNHFMADSHKRVAEIVISGVHTEDSSEVDDIYRYTN